MSTSDQRARDKDRDAAIEVVEAAWADGQIVDADRDRRVEELLRAQTLAEIRMLTHDLQLPGSTDAVVATPTVSVAPAEPAFNPYGTPAADYPSLAEIKAMNKPKAPGLIGLMVLVAVVGVAGAVVVGIIAAVQGVDAAIDSATSSTATPLPGEQPEDGVNVLSEDGYDALLADLRDGVGSTVAFDAVLYPGYAVVTMPVDSSSQRLNRWYWNGALDDLESYSTTTDRRFDLRRVNMDVVVELVKKVRNRVDDPTSWYAVIRAPDPDTGQALSVYASNEFSESAYLLTTLSGRVVYDSTKP